MEVENNEAATNTAIEANDPVMVEDNVDPEANMDAEATVTPVITDRAIPPPRTHTMELVFDHDDHLVTIHWPIMIPPTALGPQYDYHVERRRQV